MELGCQEFFMASSSPPTLLPFLAILQCHESATYKVAQLYAILEFMVNVMVAMYVCMCSLACN